MPPQDLEFRVESVEQRVSELEQLPAMVAEVGSQVAQLRGEMHAEFSAIRGNGADLSLATLVASLGEVREEIRAIRGHGADSSLVKLDAGLEQLREEMRAFRGNVDLSLATLRDQIAAIQGEGGEGLAVAALRQEIRDGDEETRRLVRVLHEDVVERIARLGEGGASGGPRSPGHERRRKKRGGP